MATTKQIEIYAVRINRQGESTIHSTHATRGAADDAAMGARADLTEGSSEEVMVERYRATLERNRVTIERNGVWAGTGTWSGERIEDCPADLGDNVYEALDEALRDAAPSLMYARLNADRTEGTIVRALRADEDPSNDIPDGMVAIDVSGLGATPVPGTRVSVDEDGCAVEVVS